MFKKFLSVLLAVMMIVSVLTVGLVTANAATTDGFTPSANKIYFDIDGAVDANGTAWSSIMKSTDKVAFYLAGGDFDTETNATKPLAWGAKKLQGTKTAGETGIFEFDPAAKGYTLTEGVQYKVIFVRCEGANWKDQTCSLFFTTDCLGHVAKCDGTSMENDVDSTKSSLAVYWDDSIDPAENGPALCITSIGNVVGSCVEQGKTKFDLLVEFLSEPKDDFKGKTGYENAHKYKCEISETADGYKSEQKLIDDIGEGLGFTKDDVQAAFDEDVVKEYFATSTVGCSWDYATSTLPGGSAHEHTPGEAVIENDTPSTCKVAGTYDEVVYCTECGEELSRETKNHELAAHSPDEAIYENVVPASCKAAGSQDKVVYCSVCGDEISRETIVIGKLLHTPGEAVYENVVPASCKAAGSQDKVVYCTVCGDEISRETIVIGKLLHTPGDVQIENEKAADCVNGGSYDEVVYCTACGDELSRETKNTDPDPDAHAELIFVEEKPATASVDGMKEHYECPLCGKCFADAEGATEVQPEDLVIKAEHVRGDADGNGFFDMTDVTALQRKLVDFDVEGFDAIAADADLDGELDVIDVTLMQRVLAQMTTFEKWDARHPKA